MACCKQIGVLWKELKTLEKNIKELGFRQRELDKTTELFNAKIGEKCQTLKENFVEINRNSQMVE